MWIYPEIRSLADIPRYHARKTPNRLALQFGNIVTSFAELDQRSNQVANALLAMHLGNEARVAFLGRNSDEFMIYFFGVMKAGMTFVPLNWRLSTHELLTVLDDSGASVLFVHDQTRDPETLRTKHNTGRIYEFDPDAGESARRLILTASSHDPRVEFDEQKTALQIYTSGTTGLPKGVELTHSGFNYALLNEHLSPHLDWQPDDIYLWVLPSFHLAGIGMSLQAIHSGVPLVIVEQFSALGTAQAVARFGATITYLVPTAIHQLIEEPDALLLDLSSLRMIMYAGSPISPQLATKAIERISCHFLQIYGATETASAVTILSPEDHQPGSLRLGSCGKPLPLSEIRIEQADGSEASPGTVGEIVLRTPGIMKGYWNNHKGSTAVLRNGWYRSGDAGYKDEDGYVFIVDRLKDMIITGGENVYSAEVERVVGSHPAVGVSAVVGTPDDRWGEVVTAFVVVRDGGELSLEQLAEHCRPFLASYKLPRRLVMVESMPLSDNGKILKRRLRDMWTPT